MLKSHPSLIFYFIINFMIFTSCARVHGSYENFENLLGKLNVEESEDSKVIPRQERLKFQESFPQSDAFKFRRDSSASETTSIDNFNDFTSMLDEANLRYVLERLQTRDVNGQKALTKASDTFNGKLISCFIHPHSPFILVPLRLEDIKFIVLFFS